jgi:hypothetical protein
LAESGAVVLVLGMEKSWSADGRELVRMP